MARQAMTTKETIDSFLVALWPHVDLFPPNSCIELTRIVVECLKPFGVAVDAVACELVVQCVERKVAFVGGATRERRAQAFKNREADDIIDMHGDELEASHVVGLARGGDEDEEWLLDLTLSQASAPSHGMILDRCPIVLGPLSGKREEYGVIEASFTQTAQAGAGASDVIEVRWTFREDRTFEQAPAWEPSHLWPLIGHVCSQMRLERAVRNGGSL